MEDQTKIDDQNTQQSRGKPTSLPPVNPVPKKPKINYWILSTLVLLILVVVTSVTLFFTLRTNKLSEISDNPSISPTITLTEIPSPQIESQVMGKLAFIREDNLWFSEYGVEK